ncbi:DUF1642 domain-containing protein [Listeria innocua]|uniref:DUF1642 domain-containing protein n=1 Tax=Listeria innocua TaxID=1642 RepID=UPI00162693B2|nr:DUF1642 domain-containing protein [Listeria innocua]MBC2136654.1 DUF1642 domain-containing protein [Listeria innocua]
MRFREGDRVELILRSKKRVGTVEEVYNDTQKCKVQIDGFPVTVTKLQKYLVKAEEAERLVVPQFVADWINYCEQRDYDLSCLLDYDDSGMSYEIDKWLRSKDSNQELLARAWLDGYEVKKEPLYYVRFFEGKVGFLNVYSNGSINVGSYDQCCGYKTKFTEAEIKKMDERYWQFAVPVGEAEGEA